MNREQLIQLFQQIETGKLTSDQALQQLEKESYEELGFAKVDHARTHRKGFPEVVYGENKTPEQILHISQAHLKVSSRLLITRLSAEKYEYLKLQGVEGDYSKEGRVLVVTKDEIEPIGHVTILTAGTSDLFVAAEAKATAEVMGNHVELVVDVGVAGIHRLFSNMESLEKANVIVVIAGMEGALASVVGGLASVPVIAVPTSVGYGTSFQGVTALLGMLNSCAPGVSVVNIDNGFGAGFIASQINHATVHGSKS